MTTYPDVITEVRSVIPLRLTYDSRTLVSQFESDAQEKRRQKWTVQRRRVELTYTFMTQEETRILWQFWLDRKGALEPFTFFYPNADVYTKEFIGVAQGGETSLRLPCRRFVGGSTYTLRKNNAIVSPAEYVVVDLVGPDGEAMATLNTSASVGDRFDFSFNAELGMQMRFESNSLDFEVIKARGSWSVVLQELIHNMTTY